LGSLLAALATIVLAGLAALFAVPHFVDWNDYKAQFETQAATLVGRPVAIQGDIDLSILPVPRLSVRGLRISDEFGRFDSPFAEVEEFNAVLALPPLLRGTIEAKSVKLDQPIVRLKIDDFGEGTWLSIGPHGLAIPLPVKEVVLNQVDIRDGAIELRRGESRATRFDRISGQLSADGLSGPFRFEGVGAIGGGDKKIQLAAVKSQDSPNLRLKGALRSMDGVSLYQLDGEIKGLDGPVHYEGPVAARLALDTQAKKAETEQIAEPMVGKAIELRASAKVTLEDAKLDDITLTVTQDDRPQSLTGWAHASWKDTPQLDLSINASWLDIDQMLRARGEAGEERPVPAAVIAALPSIFEGWAFRPRRGTIDAKIKQAGLGGDVLEDVDFVASHDAAGWKIDTLVAQLPGDTDMDVKGTLPAGEALAFDGRFELKGKNLSRLMRWSAPSLGVVDTGNFETFALSSGVTLTPEQLAFRNAKGSLGESSFTGDLVHDYGDDSRLLLALESERLDLRTLYSSQSDDDGSDDGLVPVAPYRETQGWSAETVPTRKTRLIDVLRTVFKAEQSNVSLLVSRLQLPEFEARDVRSAFRYEDGTFDFRELNLATTDGLSVEASGRITGFESRPNGSLKLSVDAPSAQSVTNLARLVSLDGVSRGARRRIEALSPFQLRGEFNADASEQVMKLTMAGKAGGSELTFNGRVNGSIEQLDRASVNIEGGIGNSDGSRLIAQLAPEVPLEEAAKQKGAGYLKVSALGTMESGLASKIELQTPQARGQFEGELASLTEPSWRMNGNLTMRATQAATALSMLRLSPGGVPVTGAIDLQASISRDESAYQVSDLELTIGGETVRGTVKADVSGDRPVANIDINAASVSVPKIAAYLVDWEREDAGSSLANVASGAGAIWPEQTFALSAFQGFDGTIAIKAPKFLISEGLALTEGAFEASLDSGTLAISSLTGQIFGGTATASGKLQALEGRVALDGKLALTQVDLAALSRANGGQEVATGTADLTLAVNGEGISPRGLVTVASGDGQLDLSGGEIIGLSPTVLKTAATAYLNQEIPDKDQLAASLDTDLQSGNLSYDAKSVPMAVNDGVLRINDVNFVAETHRVNADLTVDFGSLRFDSEWIVDGQVRTEDGEKLPPVQMVFSGPLAAFSSANARLNAHRFERFLSIKRMDQDMDRLEQLNRQRGIPPSADEQRQAPDAEPEARTPEAEAETVSATSGASDQDENAIPSQSLLRAPATATRSEAIQAPSAAGAPASETDAAAPITGWSAGVEVTDEPEESGDWQTDALQSPEAPGGDFESRIREVLRSQQSDGQPSYQ